MDAVKFYAKWAVLKIRAARFFFAPVRPNTDGWENRILLINLDLIGDIVMFTAVLKHYHAGLPGKKIFLLLNGSSGVSPVLVRDCVDEVLLVDTEKFKSSVGYSYSFIKQLREIGFATVVEHNPGVEFVGKVIAVELGARDVIGYHGFAIDDVLPSSENFAMGLRYFRRTLSRKFTKIVPTIKEPNSAHPRRLAHMISHYAAIFEGVTGTKVQDFIPRLPDLLPSDDAVQKLLREHNLAPFSYCLLSLGTSTTRKEWPIERFAELAKSILARNIAIVITGGKKDISKSAAFVAAVHQTSEGNGQQVQVLDLTGKTTILEAASLVKFSKFAMSNDTAIAHFAIVFRRPSLTILWLAQPGRTSIYGYAGLNRWIFKENFPCFADNGRCALTVRPGDPAPCVAAITVEDAKPELMALLDMVEIPDFETKKSDIAFSLAV